MLGISCKGYKDCVRRLKENELIGEDEEKFLIAVVGFRNIIVHEYSDIDLSIVEEILKERKYRKILQISLKIKQKISEVH
ncbi:DUF86 domain-containing protein [Saccharolobus solfataricus]|nr:HepT-like ribonuclease domain-containing protein [Saccharolobus solfataricus]